MKITLQFFSMARRIALINNFGRVSCSFWTSVTSCKPTLPINCMLMYAVVF